MPLLPNLNILFCGGLIMRTKPPPARPEVFNLGVASCTLVHVAGHTLYYLKVLQRMHASRMAFLVWHPVKVSIGDWLAFFHLELWR